MTLSTADILIATMLSTQQEQGYLPALSLISLSDIWIINWAPSKYTESLRAWGSGGDHERRRVGGRWTRRPVNHARK